MSCRIWPTWRTSISNIQLGEGQFLRTFPIKHRLPNNPEREGGGGTKRDTMENTYGLQPNFSKHKPRRSTVILGHAKNGLLRGFSKGSTSQTRAFDVQFNTCEMRELHSLYDVI